MRQGNNNCFIRYQIFHRHLGMIDLNNRAALIAVLLNNGDKLATNNGTKTLRIGQYVQVVGDLFQYLFVLSDDLVLLKTCEPV